MFGVVTSYERTSRFIRSSNYSVSVVSAPAPPTRAPTISPNCRVVFFALVSSCAIDTPPTLLITRQAELTPWGKWISYFCSPAAVVERLNTWRLKAPLCYVTSELPVAARTTESEEEEAQLCSQPHNQHFVKPTPFWFVSFSYLSSSSSLSLIKYKFRQ